MSGESTPSDAAGGPVGPLVALVCSPGGSTVLRSLAAALARRVDLRALGRAGDAPVAVLASDPGSLAGARTLLGDRVAPRTAVVVGGELLVRGPGDEEVLLPLPTGPGVDSASLPPLAPHVRRRWRERFGLPLDLVVDTAAVAPDDVPTALAVAAAAVVDRRHLPTALALGCPVATDGPAAASVGATDRWDLVVGGRSEAVALAADDERAAVTSRRARDLAVARLDPASTAARVLATWGLADRSALGRVGAALDELGTAPGAPPARRAAEALALLTPSAAGGL